MCVRGSFGVYINNKIFSTMDLFYDVIIDFYNFEVSQFQYGLAECLQFLSFRLIQKCL